MSRYSLLVISFLLLSGNLSSQNKTPFFKDWRLGVSYFGNNLWNPGLQFSGEKVLTNRQITKTRKEKTKIKFRQQVLDAKLGFYYDNPTHLTLFNNYTYNYRRVRNKGKFLTVGLGPGISRVFLPETYTVSSAGIVERVRFPGRTYFTPVFTLGSGRLWKRNGTNAWQLKIHTLVQVNHNNGFLPLLNVEYGYLFGYKSKEVSYEDDL